MKLKGNYFFTLREDSKDEESISGNLLVRAGMIKKVSAGIYMYLPLGLKVLDNIKKIIKEEMDKTGALELLMPSLIPSEIYDVANRNELLGDSMFHLNDRFQKPYVLGPTHEELFTMAAKYKINSYKDLPFTLYQQADKFRDEPRPRYGLVRVREFCMKDAYSFDKDEEGLDKSYLVMKDAYNKIFARMHIDYKIVKADTGVMGGSLSEEYQAVTDIGEDILVLCDHCDYASNIEVSKMHYNDDLSDELKLELVETKDKESILDVASFLNIDSKKTVKALLMNVDNELVVFFVRGDRELNVIKASKLLKAKEITFANDELISTSNAVPGFTGPINLNAKIVIDEEILHMKNFVVGANKKDYHYINCNVKDFKYDLVGDIINVQEGDICPICNGKLYFKKGIEIGNIFKLGTKYSEAFNLTYLDEENNSKPVLMGCYGMGAGRILASIIEQNNDENGIIFPMEVAPFKVCIVLIDNKNAEQVKYANELYTNLNKMNIDTLLDDRDERPGIKFKDMDLIGIPIRITVGKKLNDGLVEVKLRKESTNLDIKIDEIIDYITDNIKK